MGQPLPPTPPVLPPIRTMADDLASAERGESGASEFPVSAPRLPGTPRGTTTAHAQPIALPLRTPARPGRHRAMLWSFVVFAVVVLGLGTFGVFTFVSKVSGTVADAVPAEAVAFASVRLGQGGTEPFVSVVLAGFPGLTSERLQGATDVAYVLLPGSSPAEPVAALLVRGLPTVDLSASPTLSTKTLPGGVLLVETAHRGRVEGLTGKVWGREIEFRRLLRGMSLTAPVLMAFRSSALGTLLQPFVFHPVFADAALALTLMPNEGTSTARVQGRVSREVVTSSVPGVQVDVPQRLPRSVILAGLRPNVLSDVTALPASGRLPSSLASVLRVFSEQHEAARAFTDAAAGPWALGVLPTGTPGVRDGVAIIPLKSGSDPRASLRTLESFFARLGPYLTGSDLPAAAFSEAEYRGVVVRYVNFGSSARAFDYAVMPDALLLATSRASMAALIDAMHGEGTLVGSPAFTSLSAAAQGTDWLYLLADQRVRPEVPAALAVFHDLLPAVIMRPVGSKDLEGLAVLSRTPSSAEVSVEGEAGTP